eukprot:m.130670 g.130670  ORF g.130670 m.130670 type:complete len:431 (-) comp19991_c0_seq5:53-1345(-)
MYEHYMFVESENSPATDPLMIWTNGGPGASSLFGLFVELGPYYLDENSLTTVEHNTTGIPTLFANEHRWSKFANILILNSPPPVGFSYCTPAGPAGRGDSCGNWNDTRTAIHNFVFLQNWYSKFPQFKSNDLFIVGESYAGVYVPMLAELIFDNDKSINLKGFAIGDACAGTEVLCGAPSGPFYHLEFLHGHGQFSDKLYREIHTVCTEAELQYGHMSAQCTAAVNKVQAEVGGYYSYNLYDECYYSNIQSTGQPRSYWGPPPLSQALLDYPCGGYNALVLWVNKTEVKAALHVPADAFFFSGDNGVGFNYTLTEKSIIPFIKRVVESKALRVLVYNGDTDPGINSFVAQNWTSSIGFAEVEPWRPWTTDGEQAMGGYVTRYATDFDFLTIRGAGHMVPEYQPKNAAFFMRQWLLNQPWPKYSAAPSKRN